LRRWLETLVGLWERAKNERSTPYELGWAIGVGVFAGCTPFFGFHMWVALALATLLRLNRLWAFVGSRVSFTPLFAFITFCEIESAHLLRTGTWAPLTPHDALDHGKELLADWFLGTILVGVMLGAALGLAASLAARRWGERRSLRGAGGT
jgi:uncharacterized protein (DUF2062 family)